MVGSSKKITEGFPNKLIAKSSRRLIPPEYVDTLRLAASIKWKDSKSSSALLFLSGKWRNAPIMHRFSLPVKSSSIAAYWPVRLICSRTLSLCRTVSNPQIVAFPSSGFSSVESKLTVVVFPAPLDPKRAKIQPLAMVKSIPLRTLRFLNYFSREVTLIIVSFICFASILVTNYQTYKCMYKIIKKLP